MARILIVDDDKDLLFLIGEYLSAYGLETVLASSVAQARNFLEISHFDAIVSDFSMPGESGLDLLDHVSFMYRGLPFIMMTGYRMSGLRKQAMKKGCRTFLLKPFEFKELAGAIETAMGYPNRRDSRLALTA